MKGNRLKIFILLITTQLSACVVLSKSECLNADWREIGYGVAISGNKNLENAFSVREKACNKHGTTANFQEFKQGHSDGSVQFCQLDNAVDLGIQGKIYVIDTQICPEQDYQGFYQAFNTGYRLRKLHQQVRNTSTHLSQLNKQLDNDKADINKIEKELRSNNLAKKERNQLKHKRKELQQHLFELEHDIERYEHRLHQNQITADNYSDFIHQDYLLNLNNKFIDPR